MYIIKKTFLILFLIFSIKFAFADCSSTGMQFFPSTKKISLNSKFMIQGYAYSQEIINSFKNRIIYLESHRGELIQLRLQEILKGQMQLTQAIFSPVSELKPNTTYTLKYSNQTKEEGLEMIQYNRKTKKREKVYWETTDKKSIDNLNANLNLEFEKTEVIHYGCGPEANAIFKIKNKSDAEVWYKTEVIEIETNKKSIYYIREWNGKLNVGHGMCSGAFTFNRQGKYKVRFTPMDIDGKSLKTTDWKTFQSPFSNNTKGF